RYLGRAYRVTTAAGGYPATGTASGAWLATAVSFRPDRRPPGGIEVPHERYEVSGPEVWPPSAPSTRRVTDPKELPHVARSFVLRPGHRPAAPAVRQRPRVPAPRAEAPCTPSARLFGNRHMRWAAAVCGSDSSRTARPRRSWPSSPASAIGRASFDS